MTSPAVALPKVALDEPVSAEAINALVQRIVAEFKPQKIILFGSHAYGDPKPWSDVDLLIVMELTISRREQRRLIYQVVAERNFGLDLLVYAPQDLEERVRERDYFLREIVSKGKVLYAHSDK